MSTQRVVFAGKSLPGFDRDTAIQNLARLLKRTPEQAAAAFNGKDVVIKKGVPAAEAERLCQALERAGLMVHAEAESSLSLALDAELPAKPAAAPAPTPGKTVPADGVVAPNLSLVDYEEPEAAKAPAQLMICPACNHKQEKTEICGACGVVIAKFLQRQAAAKAAAKPAAPAPATAPAEAPAKKPLGGLLGGLVKRLVDDGGDAE